MNLPLLSIVTFLPLVGAIVIGFLPRDKPDWARWTALVFALAAWIFSLFALIALLPDRQTQVGFQFVEEANWIPAFGIQ